MERLSVEVTLQYLRRLAPDQAPVAEAILAELPHGWHCWIPRPCRRNDGSISAPAIAHALLHIIDPARFPASRRIALLASYIQQFRSVAHTSNQSSQQKGVLQ